MDDVCRSANRRLAPLQQTEKSMSYQSTHTGPEIDAAVTMLGDIQEAKSATAADRQVVETLAPQVEANAQTASDAAAAAEADRIAAQEAAQAIENTVSTD